MGSWKFIARQLGLSEANISSIADSDHAGDDREKCYLMLEKWRKANEHTYDDLGKALKEENEELFDEYVKKVLQVEKIVICKCAASS